jgi:hypothetical protein
MHVEQMDFLQEAQKDNKRRLDDHSAFLNRIESVITDNASRGEVDSDGDLTTASSTEHVTRM